MSKILRSVDTVRFNTLQYEDKWFRRVEGAGLEDGFVWGVGAECEVF